MRVEVESGIKISARTVGYLRKVTVWPDNLAITTPQKRYPESAVRVSKVQRRHTHFAETIAWSLDAALRS